MIKKIIKRYLNWLLRENARQKVNYPKTIVGLIFTLLLSPVYLFFYVVVMAEKMKDRCPKEPFEIIAFSLFIILTAAVGGTIIAMALLLAGAEMSLCRGSGTIDIVLYSLTTITPIIIGVTTIIAWIVRIFRGCGDIEIERW